MARVNKRYPKNFSQLHGHIPTVRIVAVDKIRYRLLPFDVLDGFVDVFVQMRPQHFLALTLPAAALDSNDAALVADLFDRKPG